jgi:hypothetical protein
VSSEGTTGLRGACEMLEGVKARMSAWGQTPKSHQYRAKDSDYVMDRGL